jgi:hypothetical protein
MASSRKVAERNRKREEREARAEAGIPDVRQVDASIVHGLASALHVSKTRRRGGTGEAPVRASFRTDWVMRAAMRDLTWKTAKGKPLSRAACAAAIRERLTVHDEDTVDGSPPAPARQPDPAGFDDAMKTLMSLVETA